MAPLNFSTNKINKTAGHFHTTEEYDFQSIISYACNRGCGCWVVWGGVHNSKILTTNPIDWFIIVRVLIKEQVYQN